MPSYTTLTVEVRGRIGIITLNRPEALNAFNQKMSIEIIEAFRELNQHPETIFTVLTGNGRFFSAGADVKAPIDPPPPEYTRSETKVHYLSQFTRALELLRSMIDHSKVLVLALNGPAVGGGAAWFEGVADIVFAAKGSWLQVPFNALGLVPENGSALHFAQNIGIHRANDILMFGRKCSVEELESWGMVNRIFPSEGFHNHVLAFLEEQLAVNDGKSMIETKRLQNSPLRKDRLFAVYESVDALAERFVDGAPRERFAKKRQQLLKGNKANTGDQRGHLKSSL
ncbi:ClpP/crotonase-like domain-containing protein [Talaromyces proteolyticus]|uniref:ClpP/crotonase-like domain-containing protein n=1 Tax=Talaromyces proteolyticus TaxID=1131652 RepID=A0AAD4KQR0_9EURO|nr:ClpP/crotonase-like domain-containing protein [Talaromyces proteolyticus]KAH8693989.1 ClpP/crotonase-like domain-containing protein [Talaromyces proteolyticus]